LTSILEEAPEKEEMQNEFEKYNAIGMIILILSSTKHENMVDELYLHFLILSSALLEGGNKKIQNSFYNFFTTFPKSELIFQKLYSIINNYTELLKLHSGDI